MIDYFVTYRTMRVKNDSAISEGYGRCKIHMEHPITGIDIFDIN